MKNLFIDSTEIISIIKKCAQIPSFSSYEDRIHPLIEQFIKENNILCSITKHHNNLIIETNEKRKPTIAFAAHLDKIDHFNEDLRELNFKSQNNFIEGQLDDSVGLGICLYLLLKAKELNFPNTLFLFSEMEESYGLRINRNSLKNNGLNLYPQIGAERISNYLIAHNIIPSIIITIDTTPLFYGTEGIALYSKFWEKSATIATTEIINKTNEIENIIQQIYPDIRPANNVNDYVKYGKIFADNNHIVPSIAIEPSIYPYHTISERVYVSDIEKVADIIIKFVELFAYF